MDFSGKVVLVTGGSQGIGYGIAELFCSKGARIYFSGRNEEKLKKVQDELKGKVSRGGSAKCITGDVADPKSAENIIDAIQKEAGRLDILVNNAGVTKDNIILRMKEEEWDEVLNTNLKGAFFFTKAALKYMIRQKSGRIINISSVVGSMGNPGQANYCASKAGVEGFTRSVAREVASRNITVNAIAPGYVVTSMTEVLTDDVKANLMKMIPLGRLGTTADIAGAVMFLASDEASYITGQVLHVNGGMYM